MLKLEQSKYEQFNLLYKTYFEKMVIIAARRLFNKEKAMDMAQEVFCLFWLKLLSDDKKVVKHPNIGGWLIKTLDLMILNENRSSELKSVPYDEGLEFILAAPENDRSLEDCLPLNMPDEDKELIVSFYEEGKSYDDIASEFRITPAYCRMKMTRARRKCKELLKKSI